MRRASIARHQSPFSLVTPFVRVRRRHLARLWGHPRRMAVPNRVFVRVSSRQGLPRRLTPLARAWRTTREPPHVNASWHATESLARERCCALHRMPQGIDRTCAGGRASRRVPPCPWLTGGIWVALVRSSGSQSGRSTAAAAATFATSTPCSPRPSSATPASPWRFLPPSLPPLPCTTLRCR